MKYILRYCCVFARQLHNKIPDVLLDLLRFLTSGFIAANVVF